MTALSELRAANVSLSAYNQIGIYTSAVDTYANLTMTAGTPGSASGRVEADLSGIDSVTDPSGSTASHSIHLANVTSYGGDAEIYNLNGDLRVGNVRSYYDRGNGNRDSGSVYLYATGAIVADGGIGGGRIDASNLSGVDGDVELRAGGSLGPTWHRSRWHRPARPICLSAAAIWI